MEGGFIIFLIFQIKKLQNKMVEQEITNPTCLASASMLNCLRILFKRKYINNENDNL